MATRTSYGVDELERILGVRARTIHFWVQSGLLPGPGAGRGARYQDEHLGRLFLIRKLRAERRPIPEIADAVQALSIEQVRALAAQAKAESRAPRARSSELVAQWVALPASGPQVGGESWTRLALRPDVELHVKQPLSADSRALVDAILAAARQS
ncbi:MAG: helix-turn-helix domain-containing protein [Vicinamibacterales bacterium]